MHVQPLTRKNSDGVIYERTEEVEQQISAALAMKPGSLIERARLRDYKAAGHLREECLVYMIREYLQRGKIWVVKRISEILIGRCAKFVNKKLQALGPQEVDDAFNTVFKKLFDHISNLDSDRGDFLQVRFWPVLARLTTSTFSEYLEELNTARSKVSLSSLPGYESELADDESRTVTSAGDEQETSISVEDLVLSREALRVIKNPYHRAAFVLHFYSDWKIESKDADEPTISKHFQKTPRTINNWLRAAEEDLQSWRGETI